MTQTEQWFLVKLAAAAELAPSMLARLGSATFRKPLVRLRGPLGEFLVRHDGYYNPAVAAYTAMQHIPGIDMTAGSSFSSMLANRGGFSSPKIIPYNMWRAMKQPPMPLRNAMPPKVASAVPGQAPINVSQSAGRLGDMPGQAQTSNLPYFSRLFPMSHTDLDGFQNKLKGSGILDFFGKKTLGAEYKMPNSTFQPSSLFPIWRP